MNSHEVFENAVRWHDLYNKPITEGEDRSEEVKKAMQDKNNWIVNDYDSFVDSLNKSNRSGFLTHYTAKDLYKKGATTYQLKGYNIGYALCPDPEDGEVDIISVHNNEPNVHNIGDLMLTLAKENGGTKLDHFEGKLSDIYKRNGFKEYDRYQWDDQYAPKDWDYQRYGRPDVVMRKIDRGSLGEWIHRQMTLSKRMSTL